MKIVTPRGPRLQFPASVRLVKIGGSSPPARSRGRRSENPGPPKPPPVPADVDYSALRANLSRRVGDRLLRHDQALNSVRQLRHAVERERGRRALPTRSVASARGRRFPVRGRRRLRRQKALRDGGGHRSQCLLPLHNEKPPAPLMLPDLMHFKVTPAFERSLKSLYLDLDVCVPDSRGADCQI